MNILLKIHQILTIFEELKCSGSRGLVRLSIKCIKKCIVFSIILLVKIQCVLKRHDKENDFNGDVIVSLTSFPGRISSVWLTVMSMFNQTIMPSKVILYLSIAEFPEKKAQLPNNLIEIENNIFEIRFVNENLRSHNKYYYAFQDFPNKSVITVDDDIYYPNDTIECLIKLEEKYPNTICANVTSCIEFNYDSFLPYNEWVKNKDGEKCSYLLLALGFGGVLYPKGFAPSELFNIVKMKNDAYYADDLWLKAICLTKNYKVATGDYISHPPVIPFSQKIALKNVNSQNEKKNDMQWANLNRRYDLLKLIHALELEEQKSILNY